RAPIQSRRTPRPHRQIFTRTQSPNEPPAQPNESISLTKSTAMASHKYLTSPPNLTGMPPGVPYIIGNEAAERFNYYGMKSILTVFMAHYILNQSGALAPMLPNEAYKYTHYFVSGVYCLPIVGAIIADGFLGKYWTILSLSILYCFGHLTLGFLVT